MPAIVDITGSTLGTALEQLLLADDIQPGSAPSYQLCKLIYSFHPLGAKMVDAPIAMAQSQQRDIVIADSPEEDVRKQFIEEWNAIGASAIIFNVKRLSRIYGIASVACMTEGESPDTPLDYDKLYNASISFNVFDPLNTSGSLVLNQNPNSIDFLKHSAIAVSGQQYHRSRSVVVLNEDSIYLEYTQSAFGFVGRSVYQRALFPLKSFIQSMITDDMVSKKAGLLIAKMKQVGSIVNSAMMAMGAIKRNLLKEARSENVLSIDITESIETLNMQNVNGAMSESRKNILENIAVAAGEPAQLLNSETFAQGLAEGSEDAKAIADFINRIREEMQPLYTFFDRIVQYRAWNPDFYKIIQANYPEEYGDVDYKVAFMQWRNSFLATWPSLLTEPDSEKIKVADTKLKAIIAMVEVLLPQMDPDNKATLIAWAQDNFNELEMIFKNPLNLDMDALREYEPPEQLAAAGEPTEPKPFDDADYPIGVTQTKANIREFRRRRQAVINAR